MIFNLSAAFLIGCFSILIVVISETFKNEYEIEITYFAIISIGALGG